MPTRELEIELITIDQVLQQRGGISDDTVAQYAEAMRAGDIFPPVELMDDGENLWLFDGVHRIKAAQRAGIETLEANITKGTRRQAEFESFKVNCKHGLPRDRGATGRVIRKILTDPEWSKIPLRQIAKHIGCSESWVRQAREKLQLRSTAQLDRSERIEVKTSDGRSYTLPSETKNRPARTVSELTRILTLLLEIDVGKSKAAQKKLDIAIRHIEGIKAMVTKGAL